MVSPQTGAERFTVGVVSRSRFEEASRLGQAGLIGDQPNEDYALADASRGLFVVADGMGGYDGGRIASHLIVDTYAKYVGDLSVASLVNIETEMTKGFYEADMALHRRKHSGPEHLQQMGATMLATQITPEGTLAYLNAGTSALLVVRAGQLILTIAERDNGPFTHNALTGSGGRSPHGSPYFADIYGTLRLLPGDRIALVTDGIMGTNYLGAQTRLEESDFIEALDKRIEPQQAANNLADASREADDTTAIIVDYK
jgi:serine/threonine protein phosphatase PrpC